MAATNLTATPAPVVKRYNKAFLYVVLGFVIVFVITYFVLLFGHRKPEVKQISHAEITSNTKSLYTPEPVVKPAPVLDAVPPPAAQSSTPPPITAAAQEDPWEKVYRDHQLELLRQQWSRAAKAADAQFERSQGLIGKRHEEKLAALRAGASVAISGSSQGNASQPLGRTVGQALQPAPLNPQAFAQQQQPQQLSQQPLQQAGQIATAYLIPPVSPFMLKKGTYIPVEMKQWMNSDASGSWTGLVTADVYDSISSRHVLIPAGTTVFGFGEVDIPNNEQPVLMLSAQTLQFKHGESLDLQRTMGQDGFGITGLSDEVNHHRFQRYGAAAMFALMTAGIRMAAYQGGNNQGYQLSPANAASQGAGDAFNRAAGTELQRTMSIKPTVSIPLGYQFNVTLVQDFGFTGPYRSQEEE